MKIRILDRILVAVAGLIVIAGCTAVALQLFFQKDVVGWAGRLIANSSARIYLIIALALLLLLGVYCLMVLFRRQGDREKFIMQKTDNGELAISLKAMENMVQKCLEQHKEITSQAVALENQKGCLVIRIRGTVAGGVSIPLTVDALQQQIKQYVTSCSGVEVKEIKVQIESSGPDAVNALFAVAAPKAPALLNSTEDAETKEKTEEEAPDLSDINGVPGEETDLPPAEVPPSVSVFTEEETPTDVPAAAAAAAEMLKSEAPEEDDERPVHQRLFSSKEEPCVMPMPPETDMNPAQTEAAETKPEKPEKTEEAAPEMKAEAEAPEAKTAEAEAPEAKPAEEKTDKPADPVEEKPAEADKEDAARPEKAAEKKKGWKHKWI